MDDAQGAVITLRRKIAISAAVPAFVAAYVTVAGWVTSTLIGKTALPVGAAPVPASSGSVVDLPASGPFAVDYRGTPGEAFSLDYSEVMVDGPLGELPTYYVPAAGDTWAVFVHGLGGAPQNGYRFLPLLHEAGFPTLLISYRNDPGTPPDPSHMHGYGLTEWPDLEAAVQYALDRGAARVLLVGESMGAATVGQFLIHSPLAERICALALDSPAVDMPRTIRAQSAARRIPLSRWTSAVGIWIARSRYPIDLSRARSVGAIQEFSGPVFIAQGDKDALIPLDLTDRLVTGRFEPTTYLKTSGAGHGESFYADPDRYTRALRSFLGPLQQSLQPPMG